MYEFQIFLKEWDFQLDFTAGSVQSWMAALFLSVKTPREQAAIVFKLVKWHISRLIVITFIPAMSTSLPRIAMLRNACLDQHPWETKHSYIPVIYLNVKFRARVGFVLKIQTSIVILMTIWLHQANHSMCNFCSELEISSPRILA